MKNSLNLKDIKGTIMNNATNLDLLTDEFHHFDDALNCFGFDESRKMNVYKVIVGILFLNSVEFAENQNIGCIICESSFHALEQAAKLFSINLSELKKILTTRSVRIPQEKEEIQ